MLKHEKEVSECFVCQAAGWAFRFYIQLLVDQKQPSKQRPHGRLDAEKLDKLVARGGEDRRESEPEFIGGLSHVRFCSAERGLKRSKAPA